MWSLVVASKRLNGAGSYRNASDQSIAPKLLPVLLSFREGFSSPIHMYPGSTVDVRQQGTPDPSIDLING